MNENYLWDKTGSDPETENLENALQAFRLQESEPPALPAKVFRFEQSKHRQFWKFLIPSTALAIILMIFSIFLFQNRESVPSIENAPIASGRTQRIEEFDVAEFPKEVSHENPTGEIAETSAIKPEKPIIFRKLKPVKTSKIVKVKFQTKERTAKFLKLTRRTETRAGETVKLTKEEKEAYQQLMLALLITSTKLNLVREKIAGKEFKQPVSNDGK